MDVKKLKENFRINDKNDGKKTIYYYECDKNKSGDVPSIIDDKYELTVYPHQWWGNIANPKVVVLALNPGYSQGVDELDSILFGNLIEKNYNSDDYYQFLFGDECGASEFSKNGNKILFKYSSVSCWWRKVFEEVLPNDLSGNLSEEEKNTINLFNHNVAFFNLVGYQSKDTSDLYTKSNSTDKIVEYVNDLVNKDRLFIFVWGKGEWVKKGLKINDMNYIEVNKNDEQNKKNGRNVNPRNKLMKNKLVKKEDYIKLRSFLVDYELEKSKFDSFVNDYKTIKKRDS